MIRTLVCVALFTSFPASQAKQTTLDFMYFMLKVHKFITLEDNQIPGVLEFVVCGVDIDSLNQFGSSIVLKIQKTQTLVRTKCQRDLSTTDC